MNKAPLADCENCPLKDAPFALDDGPEDADILIVSRSPAKSDCLEGRPFTGLSGKVLDHLLESNGVSREQVRVTNVVLCQCDKPPKAAIKACAPRLQAALAGRSVTLACGSEAASAVAGARSLAAVRGRRLAGSENGGIVVATYNPAAALREDSYFPSLQADFKRALTPPPEFKPPQVEWTEDTQTAELFYRMVSQYPVVAVDIEATGLAHTSKPLSISFSPTPDISYVVGRPALWGSYKHLNALLSSKHTKWLWHNGQYDVQVLWNAGVSNARVDEDTLLLSYACDERPQIHLALEALLWDEFDWPDYEPECVKKGKRVGFANLLPDEWPLLYKYNGYDTAGSRRLYDVLVERAKQDDVYTPYERLLIPATNSYARIETRGVLLDVEKAKKVRERDIMPKLNLHRSKACEAAGFEINLNSPKQVSEYLYDYCGLDDPGVNFGVERSIDEDSRKALLAERLDGNVRTFIKELDEFKKLDKIRGTYIDGLLNKLGKDGRLHGNFKLFGTETGRRSGSNPNLQNQPRGPLIRQLYIARPDFTLIGVDYSQAELRTAAILSQDDGMLQIYKDGRDFHAETAAKFYGAGFTKQNRDTAKTINFGVFYGQGAEAFSQMYNIRYKEAREYINAFWKMFPRAAAWKREIEQRILTDCELVSAFGRKRRFHLITPQNKGDVLREGVNFMISSPAADLTLISLIQLEAELHNILLEVHDSLLFEVHNTQVNIQSARIKEIMEYAPVVGLGWNEIPFEVDLQIGRDWGHLSNAV